MLASCLTSYFFCVTAFMRLRLALCKTMLFVGFMSKKAKRFANGPHAFFALFARIKKSNKCIYR